MKNIKLTKALLFSILALFVLSCNKNDTEVSKPTFLAEIEIVGDFNYVTLLGEPFEDPGAIATEKGQPSTYVVNGTVDTDIPGLYILTYVVTNEDGFTASATRNVFVLPEAFVPGSASIAGQYRRVPNNRASTVTTIIDGVYYMTDGWGSASSGGNPLPVPCYLMCTDGENITMPPYPTVFGGMEGNGTFNGTQMSIYTVLVDQGPFARTNVWNRQ